jgi:hypothetical protein
MNHTNHKLQLPLKQSVNKADKKMPKKLSHQKRPLHRFLVLAMGHSLGRGNQTLKYKARAVINSL